MDKLYAARTPARRYQRVLLSVVVALADSTDRLVLSLNYGRARLLGGIYVGRQLCLALLCDYFDAVVMVGNRGLLFFPLFLRLFVVLLALVLIGLERVRPGWVLLRDVDLLVDLFDAILHLPQLYDRLLGQAESLLRFANLTLPAG